MLLPLALVMALMMYTGWHHHVEEQMHELEVHFRNMVNDFSQLAFFGQEVLLHPEEVRPRQQWREKHAALTLNLQEMHTSSNEAQVIQERMRSHLESLGYWFGQMAGTITAGDGRIEAMHERRDRISSRMALEIQNLLTDTNALSQKMHEDWFSKHRLFDAVMMTGVAVLGALTILMIFVMGRKVLKPLRLLQRGINTISRGRSAIPYRNDDR